MKELKIRRLVLENFKCHRHLDLLLCGDSRSVYGDNASGKTSIYDALTWLLFGKDSLGSASMEVKPLGPDGRVLDHLAVTEVRAELLVDGMCHEFRKTYQEVWTRSKGQDREHFEGNTAKYFVDGVPCRKAGYQEKVGQLVEEEVFRMLTSIPRFAGELSWQQRREILFDLAGIADDRTLLKENPEFAELKEGCGELSLSDYSKKLLSEKKELQLAKTDLPARISELQKTLLELGEPDFQGLKQKRQALADRLQQQKNREDPMETVREQLRSAKLDLRELESENDKYRASQERPIQELEDRLSDLRRRMETLGRDGGDSLYLSNLLLEKQHREDLVFTPGVCPTCGQPLCGEALNTAETRFNQEKTRDLRRIESEIIRIREKMETARKELQNLESQADQLRCRIRSLTQAGIRNLTDFDLRRRDLQLRINDLETQLEAQRPNEENKFVLEHSIEELDRVLAKEPLIASTRSRMERLISQQEAREKQLHRILSQLNLMDRFSRFKAQLAETGVNSLFHLASFRLYREQVGGGLEPRCDVMYRGIPYGNLNNGARINVGIDIISALSRHYGIRVPLFVDNAESVTRLEDTASQVIRLVVSPEDPVLRLE